MTCRSANNRIQLYGIYKESHTAAHRGPYMENVAPTSAVRALSKLLAVRVSFTSQAPRCLIAAKTAEARAPSFSLYGQPLTIQLICCPLRSASEAIQTCPKKAGEMVPIEPGERHWTCSMHRKGPKQKRGSRSETIHLEYTSISTRHEYGL